MDLRKVDRFGHRERGKDPGKSPGKHRLAGPRWSDQQEVMAPGRGDLECALRELLATHVGQIRLPGWRTLEETDHIKPGRPDRAQSFEMIQHLSQRLAAQDFHPFYGGILSGVRAR